MTFRTSMGGFLGMTTGLAVYFGGVVGLSKATDFPIDYSTRDKISPKIKELEENPEVKRYLELKEEWDGNNLTRYGIIGLALLLSGVGILGGAIVGASLEDRAEEKKKRRNYELSRRGLN